MSGFLAWMGSPLLGSGGPKESSSSAAAAAAAEGMMAPTAPAADGHQAPPPSVASPSRASLQSLSNFIRDIRGDSLATEIATLKAVLEDREIEMKEKDFIIENLKENLVMLSSENVAPPPPPRTTDIAVETDQIRDGFMPLLATGSHMGPTSDMEEDRVLIVEALEGELAGSHAYDIELIALRSTLSIHDHDRADEALIKALNDIKDKVQKEYDMRSKQISDIQDQIRVKEREWQALSSTDSDDDEGLRYFATRGWPSVNLNKEENENGFAFDFFITYRVASESVLARELRLQLMLRGKRVYLDQEELKDGEDWRNGFVAGLKNSRIALPLVSAGCLSRMSYSATATDNVCLEWETAICAMENGLHHVVPIYIGTGEFDFAKHPKARPDFKFSSDDLYCRQSAFTTLKKLKRLDHLHHPDPTAGVPATLIDEICTALDSFNAIYASNNKRHVRLYYEMLPDLFAGPRDVDSATLWYCEEINIPYCDLEDAGRVAVVVAANKSWKRVLLSDQGKGLTCILNALNKDVVESLHIIEAKNPETIPAALTKFLSGNKTLKYFTLRGVSVEGNQDVLTKLIMDLMPLLSRVQSLKALDLSDNVITVPAIKALFSGMLSTVNELFWNWNSISVDVFPSMMKALKSHNITRVSICGTDFSRFDLSHLVTFISQSPELESLELMDVCINWDHFVNILKAMEETSCHLETLSLAGIEMGQTVTALDELYSFIRSTNAKKLKTLSLIACSLTTDHLSKLMEAVAVNETIENLDLQDNKFSQKDIELITSTLMQRKNIDSLILGSSDTSGERIALGNVEMFRSLVSVPNKLQIDGMDVKDVLRGFDALSKSKISDLSLNGVGLDDKSISSIAGYLKASHLKSLSLLNNPYKTAGARSLIDVCKKNGNIEKLTLANGVAADLKRELNDLLRSRNSLPVDEYMSVPEATAQVTAQSDNTIINFTPSGMEVAKSETPITPDVSSLVTYMSEDKDLTISNLKSSILKAAASLEDKKKDLRKYQEILAAVNTISRIEHDLIHPPVIYDFHCGYPFKITSEKRVGIFCCFNKEFKILPAEMAVVREISLRLQFEKVAFAKDHEFKVIDREVKHVGEAVPKLISPVVLPWYPTISVVTSEEQKKGDRVLEEFIDRFPLFVFVLSESLVGGLEQSIESFWSALRMWESMMDAADLNFIEIIPVYLALDGDGGGVFGKIRSKIVNRLYLLQAQNDEQKGSEAIVESINKALEIINRLFQYQGITITDIRQCGATVEKLRNAFHHFQCTLTGLLESFVTASEVKHKANIINMFKNSGEGNFIWPVRITDDIMAEEVGTILKGGSDWKVCSLVLDSSNEDDGSRPQSAKIIAEAIIGTKALPAVRLEYDTGVNLLTPKGNSLVVEMFARRLNVSSWTSLSLIGPMVNPNSGIVMAEALKSNRTLTSLSLIHKAALDSDGNNDSGIGDKGLTAIVTALPMNRSLTALDLSGNIFTESGMVALASYLSEAQLLQKLTLSGCGIKRIPGFGDSLAKNKSLKELNLRGNMLDDGGLILIAQGLQQNENLLSLNLTDNTCFGLDAMKDFAAVFKSNKTLKTLFLECTKSEKMLGSESISVLVEGLADSRIETLSLNGQMLNGEVAQKFAQTLQKLEIKDLKICDAGLDNDDAVSFAEALKDKKSLEILELSQNPVGDEAQATIVRLLITKDAKIRVLMMKGMEVSAETLQALVECLKVNESLTIFAADGYGEYAQQLTDALIRNSLFQVENAAMRHFENAIRLGCQPAIDYLISLEGSQRFVREHATDLIISTIEHDKMDIMLALERHFHEDFSIDKSGSSLKSYDTPLLAIVKHGRLGFVDYVLDVKKASHIVRDYGDMTALHCAVLLDNIPMTEKLIKKGVDIKARLSHTVQPGNGKPGYNPAHGAASRGFARMLNYLLEKDPTLIETVDDFGNTLLHVAAQGGLITVPLEGGAEIESAEEIDENADDTQDQALERTVNVTADVGVVSNNAPEGGEEEPESQPGAVEVAATDGTSSCDFHAVIRLLVKAGVSVETKNNDGETALDVARKYLQHQLVKLISGLLRKTDGGKTDDAPVKEEIGNNSVENVVKSTDQESTAEEPKKTADLISQNEETAGGMPTEE